MKKHEIECVTLDVVCHACGKRFEMHLSDSAEFMTPCGYCKQVIRGRLHVSFDNNEMGEHGDTRTHTRAGR